MAWLDDYSLLRRSSGGDYVILDVCPSCTQYGLGTCRCESHRYETEARRLSLVEAVREVGADAVREALAESSLAAWRSRGPHVGYGRRRQGVPA